MAPRGGQGWTASLTGASARRPKLAIALWLVGIVAAGGLSSQLLGDALTSEADFVGEPEAKKAERLAEERLRGPERVAELVVIRSTTATADDPAFGTFVQAMERDVAALGPRVVAGVSSYYSSGLDTMVSADRDAALLRISMAGDVEQAADDIELVHDRTVDRRIPAGFSVVQVGGATLNQDFTEISESDLAKGETFGLPIALAVLLAVFGAVVAALLPIALGIGAIVVAIGLVALLGLVFEFSFFVANMITMMGLAVGIDYSLFVVSRYREERAAGREKLDAIVATGRTASRAVVFSGATVVLALLGMLLIPTTIFRSLAAGAILVVLAAMAASVTALPALLSLLGDRVDALRISLRRRRSAGREREGGFWHRATRAVMRRPVASVVLAGGLLIAAAVPVLGMETGFSGVSTLPDDAQSKRGFQVLSEEFAGGLTEPVEIVVLGDVRSADVRDALARLRTSLASDRRFGAATVEIDRAGSLALLSLPVNADPASAGAYEAVRDLRARSVPDAFRDVDAEVLVGGATAFNVDFFDLTRRYTPIVFAFVLGLSFLLLMVVFRSLVVPAKALVMNLLSVGAAYGLVVLVNQKGYGADLLGFRRVEQIEAWLPLFLFSVLFGLSMDYHVFLLSRIKERYDQTGDNAEAVSFGVRSTAGIITGAALIMVAVFGGFAAGDLVMFQQMGFGLAVAVLLDATIVRSVLVPASMKLLGERNWYLPRWLEWIPDVRVEGTARGEPRVIDLREQPVDDERTAAPDQSEPAAAAARSGGAEHPRRNIDAPPGPRRRPIDDKRSANGNSV